MKKRVLIVGGGPEITICKDIIENNQRFEFYNISEIPSMYRELFIDSLEVDFSNWGNVIKQINELNVKFDAIACWDEAMTHIADDIAKELGLIPISTLDSQPFRYKDRMRMVCESNGIIVPRYKIINQYNDTFKVINWKFPLIVKPTSFLASIGVKKVYNFVDLQQHVANLLNVKFPVYLGASVYELGDLYGLEPRVLIEEYVEGNEFSLESIIVNGSYKPIGITQKITDESLFSDEIGHIFPCNLNEKVQAKIFSWGKKLHNVLQLQNIATHAEFRLNSNNDPVLIEIGARIGGDFIPDLINNSFFNGFSFYEEYLKARVGENISFDNSIRTYTGVIFLRLKKENYGKVLSGYSCDLTGISSKKIKEDIYKKVGSLLPNPINWSNERIGYMIFENNSYDELNNDLRKILSSIKIIGE